MKYLLLSLLLSCFLISCEDIISINITDETPEIITPGNNDTIQENPVTIKWEELKGATKYRLQIVSPSFNSISKYVLDTIIYKNYFVIQLDSSEYELVLTAYNSGYTSKKLGPIKFFVGVSPSQNSNFVHLTSPVDTFYTNTNFNSNFSWSPFENVVDYEFSFRRGVNFGSGEILSTINNIVTNTLNLPNNIVLSEGTYCWGIKAYTSNSETIFSTRKIFVDVTNPNNAILISPSNFSNVSNNIVTFNWNVGNDLGVIKSPIKSTIEISHDTFFTNLVFTAEYSSATSQATLSTGTYYWRIINRDAAGNISDYSDVYSFNVN